MYSGDSACSLPPYSLSAEVIAEIKRQTTMMAKALNVSGLMNVQFAIQGGDVYVLEVNPRACAPCRTCPGHRPAAGQDRRARHGRPHAGRPGHHAQSCRRTSASREAVFPFVKFPGVDTILGPEMKSTGEVMGVGNSFGEAFVSRSWPPACACRLGHGLHQRAELRIKRAPVEVARGLHNLGFKLVVTRGTAAEIEAAGIPVQVVNKVTEGRPQ